MRENLLSPALHDYADNRYRDRKASLGGLTIPADTLIGRLDGDRRALMHLLVGTLPTTDILECEPATLLDYVDHALELRRSRAWTAALPEDVFIHYVFWPRVNDERLEPCRSRIAGELDARVTPLDMECAAIETNYWCAEHVTYAPLRHPHDRPGRRAEPRHGPLRRGIHAAGERLARHRHPRASGIHPALGALRRQPRLG